jgi:uncharacterized protein
VSTGPGRLSEVHQQRLHELARYAIEYGLDHGREPDIDLKAYDAALQHKRATFVTLHRNKALRGCIGILHPLRPLAEDVAHNAWAAAFSDTRFSPLSRNELDGLEIHISILGTPETIEYNSEPDLVRQLRPGSDGLILEDGQRRSTFLPSVWEQLPSRNEFLRHLKQKAGLPPDYWSDTLKLQRYTVEEF